jgi:protein-S-isoprenylcysteine O-methyltransferase Ste14
MMRNEARCPSIQPTGSTLNMMQSLELKIPPPAVALVVALLMWAIARFTSLEVPQLVRPILAIALAAIGAAFDISALLVFRQARTTINPMKPRATSSIVTSGVYNLTRNPMYVGLVFFLFAWAAWLWSPWALPGPVAFAAYITRFQIVPEEKALSAMFGTEYSSYMARVRRWL